MYDSSEFKEWQQRMRHKEEQERISNQIKKKIEIELAGDLFQEARGEKLRQNKENVERFKEEIGEKRRWRQELDQKEMEIKIDIVKEVRDTRHNG